MQIRIKGYTFQLSAPFVEGTVLTKAEAQALNDLRAENIQNNIRRMISDATARLPEGELLPQAELDELQSKLTQYDLSYQFVEKHQPRPRIGDIEAEARAVAKERAEAELRQLGTEAGEGELEQMISEMERLPAVLEEARQRVSARRLAIAGSLSDL